VQEDFGVGLGEVHRARAAERVATGTMDVAERTAKAVSSAASATVTSVQEFDTKMRISERAGHAVEAVKESAVVQSAGAALSKAGSSVKSATTRVLDQPAVANATEAVGTQFRKLGASLSSLTSKVVPRRNGAAGSSGELPSEVEGAGYPSHSPMTAPEAIGRVTPPGPPLSQPTSHPQNTAFTLQDSAP